MRIKSLAIFFLLTLAGAGLARAYRPPAFDGGCGLFKVSSARTMGRGMMSVGFLQSDFGGEDRKKGDPFFQGDTNTVKGEVDKHYRGMIRLMVSYAPLDFFEFSVGPRIYATYDRHSNVVGQPGKLRYDGVNYDLALFWLENILLKTKFSYQSKEYGGAPFSYAVGAEPFVSIGFPATTAYMYTDNPKQPERPDSNLVAHGFTELNAHNPDFGAKFLGTLTLGPASLHGNLGFLKAGKAKSGYVIDYDTLVYANPDTSDTNPDILYRADSTSRVHPAVRGTVDRGNQLLWGVGMEVAAGPYVTFLVEASGEKLKNQTFTWGSPARITPGIRFNTPGGFTMDGGCEFKLFRGSTSPNWNAVFGFSVTSSTMKKTAPPPATIIAGKVMIAGTDSMLEATLTSPAINNGAPIMLKPDGSYSINVPAGTYRIRAAAGDSFLWQEKAVSIAQGQTMIVDFGLRRKEYPRGNITGKITDSKTGNAMGATINIFGPDKVMVGTPAVSDLLTGIYSINLPPNIYMVQAQAEGYNTETAPVPVNDKQTFIQNFSLRAIPKKGEKVVLIGIKFKINRADIIPSSYSILDEAAKMLKDNPTIKVEIGGHTDSRGSDAKNQRLSEARAVSVRNYLINIQGIAGDRMTAKGYGESLPIASNKTVKGRAENRRIEFVVMSQQ
ncbi:OmpA family protein [candidate division TA06 bacterium]|uniref:OmpA family protein n=1 Tax=candidate division TA06 bacterium TaxID=2250710 RepID=A0A933I9H7_UNCT6|nr:OmpA family protein [candidate division TA06 bacterium]